ncbi:MAG: sigma-70 family RNA polymerase sigma factor [Myxococcota bacterium]
MGDDVDLLERWREGDRKAGQELFSRYFDALLRFFRNKVGDDAAAELVQTTFLVCVERRDTFRAESSVRTFLFAIARRRLYSYFESRQQAGQRFEPETVSVADLGTTPSELLDHKRTHTVLLAALRTIPAQMQILLELHYWEKLPGPQLAQIFEVPEGTIRTRLRRAKQVLATRIDELRTGPRVATSEEDLEGWAAEVRAELGEAV